MKKIKSKKGQIMLLSVLLIGTSILVFSTIGGYLMLERLRSSSNIVDSTKAIFAADSGLECELYRFNFSNPENPRTIDCSTLVFEDHPLTSVEATSTITAEKLSVQSIGTSNKSRRAFLIEFKAESPAP